MLSTRCIEILDSILHSDLKLTVNYLSEKFNVSNRMIRYDIDTINDFLKDNNFSLIEKRPNSPISAFFSEDESERLIEIMKGLNSNQYILSNEERVAFIIYYLLTKGNECTYAILQEILLVSKSTLLADVRKAREELNRYGIKIVKSNNKGIIVEGDEFEIHNVLRDLLIGRNKYNIVTTLQNRCQNGREFIFDSIKKISTSNDDIQFIQELVKELDEEYGGFTDDAFLYLVMTIFIIVIRARGGNWIKECESSSKIRSYKDEYISAEKIVGKLISKFNIDLRTEDVEYLTSMILSVGKNDNNIYSAKDYFNACFIADKITKDIIKKYDESYIIDTQLYSSFINHLKGLIFRLRYKVNFKNPMVENIMSSYNKEFKFIKSKCKFIEEKYVLTDDEIAYITLYVCAAIEKNKNNGNFKAKNILIVCSAGFATGVFIQSKIKKKFNVDKSFVTSVHNVNKYLNENDIDLIISTVNVEKKYDVKIVTVTCLFSEEDMKKIDKYLEYKQNKYSSGVVSDILYIIKKNCQIKDQDKLINDLNKYYNLEINRPKNIHECIDLSNIQLNLQVSNWEEAIIVSSNPLVVNGTINTGYVQAMIDNVKEYGAYIVIDDGIAIPHARCDGNVFKFGITINTLKSPITIEDKGEVKILIVLAMREEKNNNLIIPKIMDLVEDENFIKLLGESKSPIEVYNYLENYM